MQVRELTEEVLAHATPRGEPSTRVVRPSPSRVEYREVDAELPTGALAIVRFGINLPPAPAAPLCIDVALQPVETAGLAELWWAKGPITSGQTGPIRFASDSESLIGSIELDERAYDGVCAATEAAYREILQFQERSGFPHLLRMWNYLDAINDQAGDLERYRQFCLGRARAFANADASYPAASGIGRQYRTRQLQVFWLASRIPGRAVENPRQISAYEYPREHGPASPSFSRASIAADGTMFVSGTASIVGHASQHHSDPVAQLEETLRNLQALNALSASAAGDLLKIYVRDASHVPLIRERLGTAASKTQALFLLADICRQELLLEIECVKQPHAARASSAAT